MANTVFGRLGYNFDSVNFEGADQLLDGAKKNLEIRKNSLYTWQYRDVADSTAIRSRYYRNPTANLYITLRNTANSITLLAQNLSLSNIATQANNFILELDRFKSHTDNISGVIDTTADGFTVDANIPEYETAMGVGETLVQILYAADNVANTVGALGSFTSLYINNQLTSNASILANAYTSLNSSIVVSGLPVTQSSNLGGLALETINSYIAIANTMIATRRLHDWNFFKKANEIARDMGTVSQFSNMGKMKSHLVYYKVGTDGLIANVSAPIYHDSNTGIFPT
jgi:hypothetical protein